MGVGIKKRPPQAPERLRGRLHINTVYAITTMNVLEIKISSVDFVGFVDQLVC